MNGEIRGRLFGYVLALVLVVVGTVPAWAGFSPQAPDAQEGVKALRTVVNDRILPDPLRSLKDGVIKEKKAPPFKEGELLVKFRTGVAGEKRQGLHHRNGGEKVREFPSLRIEKVKLKKGKSIDQAMKEYAADPSVEFVEPNYRVDTQQTPNDPSFGYLWGMENISAPAAWDMSTGSSDVVVAVIDTGVDYTHTDLAGNMWVNTAEIPGNGIDDDGNGYIDDIYGWNAYANNGNPFDDHGHGTHVAGTIGAIGNNGNGVAGINWNVRIMALKFLDASGSGYVDDAVECVLYINAMKARGVNVVASNNSWGGGGYSQSLVDAINADQNVLFIAAAGNSANDNDSNPFYPAAYRIPNLVAVAATDSNNELASFSNFGKTSVHVGAPGVGIYSTLPQQNTWGISGGYGSLSGTSMATPHVTGLAALLMAQESGRTWNQIKNLLMTGGDPTGALEGKSISGRRINALGSLGCNNTPVMAVQGLPAFLTPGNAVNLSVYSAVCANPAGPVTVTTALNETVVLKDDGIAPDLAPGDGLFAGSWTPTREAERLTFASPAGTVSISVPPLIMGGYLPEANTNISYNHFVGVSGGLPPYQWTFQGGTLPSGILFTEATATLSGTPTTTGAYGFAIAVTDSLGSTVSRYFTLNVSSDQLAETWAVSKDFGGNDRGWDVAVDTLGNRYVAGSYTNPETGSSDGILLKYTISGSLAWVRTYATVNSDYFKSIVIDRDGNVLTNGASYTEGSRLFDWFIQKYDSNGNLLWGTNFDSGYEDYPGGVAVDGSGNVFVTGMTGYQWNNDVVTIKYDTNGTELWRRTFDSGEEYFFGYWYDRPDYASGIAVDGLGNCIVSMYSANWIKDPTQEAYLAYYDYVTLKYDDSGNQLWANTYDSNARFDMSKGVAVDSAGNSVVTGHQEDGNLCNTVKYDPSGNLLWAKGFNDRLYPFCEAVAFDAFGNIIVTGAQGDIYSGYALQTFKYDPSGNILWRKIGAYGRNDWAKGLDVDASGNVFLAGTTNNESNSDILALSYRDIANSPPDWKIYSVGPPYAGLTEPKFVIDWHAPEHAPLAPAGYVLVTGTYYYVADSNQGSWSGSDYNAAGLQQCNQLTGQPLVDGNNLPIYPEMRGKEGQPIAYFSYWPSGPDTNPPVMVSTMPAQGETGISPNTAVMAAFNEAIDPATVGSTTFYLNGPNGVEPGAWHTNGSRIAFFPASPLVPNTTYQATVAGLRDFAGNQLQNPYSWNFTTARQFAVAATIEGNGTLNCDSPVTEGGSSTCFLTPAGGHHIKQLRDNGADVTSQITPYSYLTKRYSIYNIHEEHALVAVFEQTTYPLTVSRVGAGKVTSSPAGIDLTDVTRQTVSFGENHQVALTATASSGYLFAGWTGACTGIGACTVAMDTARSVGAVFTTPSAFLSPTTFQAGSNSSGIASGDLNNDGKADLVVANAQGNSVSVLLGAGYGIFQSATNIAVGEYPSSAAIADYNGDGKLDLAVSKTYQGISVMMGNGDGTFGPITNYAAGSRINTLISGDFNRDGKPDVVCVNESNDNVSIFLGNGDGTFQQATNFATGSYPTALDQADFNSDGKPDLVTANLFGVSVMLGNGNGSFSSHLDFEVRDYPSNVAAGDFNGDGKPDLAVTSFKVDDSYVSVMIGNGDGTFKYPVDYAVGHLPLDVKTGDFNGDGMQDLAVSNSDANSVSILLGRGDGTFMVPANYQAGNYPSAIVKADFNGDGKADLAVANYLGGISVLVNSATLSSSGYLAAPDSYIAGEGPTEIISADFNDDGRLDIGVSNRLSNNVSVFIASNDGTFLPAANYPVGRDPRSLTGGDFNGDGRMDLAVPNYLDKNVSILLGNGDGTFMVAVNYPEGGQNPQNIISEDLNGDGVLDLAMVNNYVSSISVLYGNGDGSFGTPALFTVGSRPISIVAGDFNHDGKKDLAVANSSSSDVSILLGAVGNTFSTATNYSLGLYGPKYVVAVDLDSDGMLDLAVTTANGLSVLRGAVDGTFQAAVQHLPGTSLSALHRGDFDRDGIVDLMVGDAVSNKLMLLRGKGDVTFLPSLSFATTTVPYSIVAADFDGDGRTDIAGRVYASNQVLVFRNTHDNILPVCSASPIGGLFPAATQVALSADEPASIYYTIDGSTPTIASPRYLVPVSIEYDTTLSFFAVDSHGNVGGIRSEQYRIDTTPPASMIQAPLPGAALSGTSATIAGSANDGSGSGVNKVEVSADGGNSWQQAIGSSSWSYTWNLPSDGTYTLMSRAVDSFGHYEAPTTGVQVVVDNTPPVTVTTLNGTSGDNGWFVSDVSVTVSATDNLSGVAAIEYSIDGTTWLPYVDPVILSKSLTFRARSTDKAGVAGDIQSVEVKIDHSPVTLWKAITLYGGKINAVEVSPAFSMDHTIFAGGSVTGLYRSTDAGASWSPINTGFTNSQIASIGFSPAFATDRNVMAGTSGYGLYHSTNGGDSWAPVAGIPADANVYKIKYSPDFQNDGLILAGTSWGLYRSTDAGQNWTVAAVGALVQDISFSPAFSTDQTVYIADANGKGIVRSVDGGATWTPCARYATTNNSPWGVEVWSNGIVLAAATSGTYRSTDGGQTWLSTGLTSISDFVFSPAFDTDGTVFAGQYRSTDFGITWSKISNDSAGSLAISPSFASDGTIFLAGVSGVFKSGDRGAGWVFSSNGIARFDLSAIAPSPAFSSDRTIFAATNTGGVYRSQDGGITWKPINNGITDNRIVSLVVTPSFAIDRTLYALSQYGYFFRSTNGGESWQRISIESGPYGKVLAVSPNFEVDKTLFAGEDDRSGPYHFLYRSVDGGTTWTRIVNKQTGAITMIAVSPDYATDRTLVVAASQAIRRSVDGGATWTSVSIGRTVTTLVFSPEYATDRTIYAGASSNGVYRSTDGGASWSQYGSVLTSVYALSITPDKMLIAGTDLGAYSLDSETLQWVSISEGLQGNKVRLLQVSPEYALDGIVYAGTYYSGLWSRNLTTYPLCNIATPVYLSVFNATGVLVTGTASDGTGSGLSLVELSTDAGATWTSVSGTSSWSYSLAVPVDGIYSLICRAKDIAGNIGAVSKPVTVTFDATSPLLTPPANVTAEATGIATAVTIGNATVTDAVGIVSLINNAPAKFPLGTTTVTWTATDVGGNSATAIQTVTVRDTTAPTLTAPANITSEATGVQTIVAIGTATATDAIGVVSLTNNAPATFPVGTSNVIWTATDAAGLSTNATQTVTVQDKTAPALTAPANITVEAAGAQTTVAIGTATASDAVGVVSLTNNAPATFPVGTFNVIWTATDAVGLSTTAIQTVTVQDTTSPALIAPDNITAEATGVQTIVAIGTATATDAVGIVSLTNNAPATFQVGTTTVVWTVTDAAGLSATATQAVTVQDSKPPVLSGLTSQTLDATSASGSVAIFNVTAFDLVNGAVAVTCAPVSGSTFTLGTTTVTCTAKDAHNNPIVGTFNITVQDTTAPTGMITINSEVAYTNSTAVTLTLSAADAIGVSQMAFSNDAVTWSTAEAYSTTKSWTLTATNGAKTVYVRYKDASGNWSSATAISGSIVLDTVAPAVSSTDPTNNTTAVALNKVISALFNENVQAGAEYRNISLNKSSTSIAMTTTIANNKLSIAPTALLAKNSKYTVTIPVGALKDMAGNPLTTARTISFTTVK